MSSSQASFAARWGRKVGLTREQFEVAGVVTFYMVAALTMVFVNKAVLLSAPTVPLLFLLLQLIMAVLLLHAFAWALPRHVQLPKLELGTLKKLAPVMTVSLGGLVFNTLCLRAVEAAFFQIARGLLLPLTIVVSALFTRSLPTPTIPVFLAALMVTLGFLMGVAPTSLHIDAAVPVGDEPAVSQPRSYPFLTRSLLYDAEPVAPVAATPLTSNSSTMGLFYGILSSVFIAVHSCLIKESLPHLGGSALALSYWTNLVSSLALAPIVVISGEATEFLRLVASTREAAAAGVESEWQWSTFAWGSVVTGIFGALLGLASMLSVKATSPVTHMFSSAAKSVLQTVLGVWLFHDLMTTGRASSILVILIGTLYYTWVKAQQPSPPPPNKEQEMVQRAEEEGLLAVEFDADEDEETKKREQRRD
ncbi:hypothetical protein EXIGLDRAFT_759173 [Exidia glandulosa HHB12029]|uniref:GDP-mannose transporter n=1 Tax=Exidia glandulosa HHB12029 TaxID=1314781 RepID=A0A165QA14_EXIGL|nr:hypothetical protein EXIGLDRAFT_759173 [Exidia glandulosa HHB12029]